MPRYFGGKNGAGHYQAIINQIPPHGMYIEPFFGSGAVMRNKLPADFNYAVDLDVSTKQFFPFEAEDDFTKFFCQCGIEYLTNSTIYSAGKYGTFIYCDPPYLHSTRKSKRDRYKYELTDEQHQDLLQLLTTTKAYVAISGYDNELYQQYLCDWRRIKIEVMTRGGQVTESLWMNYPEPSELHDYRYLGKDRTERQAIKRKISRWKTKFLAMPMQEREAILKELNEVNEKTVI